MENHEILSGYLNQVLQVLQNTGIRYALAGGLAYSALVQPRATMDIDVLVLLDNAAFTRVLTQLETFFNALIAHKKPMKFNGVRILQAVGYVGQKEIILDFLLAESEFHYCILDRAIDLDFLGSHLKVVTIEDLVLLKKYANRPQDIIDIETIYTLCQDELDDEYITNWSKTLMLS